MRRHAFVLLGLLGGAAAVSADHDDDLPIGTSTDLRDWCKAESEAYFVAKGATPFNWTASDVERGNTLFVEGKWRIDGVYYDVHCRITRGAQRQYAVIDIETAK